MNKIFVFLVASILTNVMYPGVAVYLENNYGETLNYKISSEQSEGRNIATNSRELLGDIDYLPELQIRSTSMVASYLPSYTYYNQQAILDKIKNQQNQHRDDDAIITIDRIGIKQWGIDLRWEKKSKMPFEPMGEAPKVQPAPSQPFTQPAAEIEIDLDQLEKEEDLMATTTADGRLNKIKAGALGPEYARKATEICSASYTQAEKLGKINLCSRLKTELLAPKYDIAQKRIKKLAARARAQGAVVRFVLPDLEPAINDIKASINRIHNALGGYKSRGEAF